MHNRFFKYLVLAGLALTIPYLVTIVCIVISEDRITGMKHARIPGILIVHLLFGLFFISKTPVLKVILSAALSCLAFALVYWMTTSGYFIRTGLDIYRFWDLAIANLIAGLMVWEGYYQVNSRIIR